MGRTVDDLRKLCPAATVTEGLAVRGSAAGQAAPAIDAWLNNIGRR